MTTHLTTTLRLKTLTNKQFSLPILSYYTTMKINLLKILILLTATACTDYSFEIYPPHADTAGHEATVTLAFSTVEQTGELNSRSVDQSLVNEGTDAESNPIHDVWLIEYDDKGIILGSPKYFADPSDFAAVTLILPADGKEYTLVAIANTGHDALGDMFKTYTDITTLHKAYKAFNSESCGYNTITNADGETEHLLLMNGSVKLTNQSETEGIAIPLHRNVAKIDVTITNKAGSGVNIKKARLCNVPSRISYADQMVKGSSVENATYITLQDEIWNPQTQENDEVMNLMYYIPRNMQGTVENSSGIALQKNRNVPTSATYLEIIAEDATDKSALRYRFYLGKNMVDNFDIEPNHHYSLPIVISSKGDATADSRVEIFKNGIFSSSNSYILTYRSDYTQQNHVTVPIDRINYFWGHTSAADPEFILQTETKWVAEVIWQDTNTDIFHFCNADGTEVDKPHFFEGIGKDSNFSVKPTGKGSGNVLIGVRRADHDGMTDGYMWSWYFWITDYYPYTNETLTEDKYCYAVDHGQIHRYDTQVWKEQLPATEGYYIMDRNFGAYSGGELTETTSTSRAKHTGVYFRFGCKDPLPWNGTTIYKYNIETDKSGGSPIKTALVGDENRLRTLEESVKHPNWYYHSGDLWLTGINYTDWLRPEWDTKYNKSLFDPSPAGWMLPLIEHSPAIDNFTSVDQSLNFYGSRALLDRSKPYSTDNVAYFNNTSLQRVNYTGPFFDANWSGAIIITKSKATNNSNFKTWCFYNNQGVFKYYSVREFPRRFATPTRLIRDPSTDPRDN